MTTPTTAATLSHEPQMLSTSASYGTRPSVRAPRRAHGEDDQHDAQADGDDRPPQPEIEGRQDLAEQEEPADDDEHQARDQSATHRVVTNPTGPRRRGAERHGRSVRRAPRSVRPGLGRWC